MTSLVKALCRILDIKQTVDSAETFSDQLLLSMEELYSTRRGGRCWWWKKEDKKKNEKR